MKWNKRGKIFDPAQGNPIHECFAYAQSPQALVFEDFIRIYFSTRQKDGKGKFLSHVAFVDFDRNFKTIIGFSTNTVIPLGNLGCFDEHGIFPFHVVRDGERILAYTCGWSRRVSVSVETSIGLASSYDNGLTFQRLGGGPVLTSSLHEPFLVGDPFVVISGGTYHMWYIYGTKWGTYPEEGDPQRVYKIGHAKSDDGISWHREGRQVISDKLNADECQALPTVIMIDDTCHMFFCYRQATGFRTKREYAYRIGYAHSKDMQNWTRDDDKAGIDVSTSGWDSDMVCYPHVFESGGSIYMLYNGNEFGRGGFGLAVLE